MKKLILITIGASMFSMASYAQLDTTKRVAPVTPAPVQQIQAQPLAPPSTIPSPQPSNQVMPQVANPTGLPGWTPMESQAVPDNLRQTLTTSPQLKGWESGTIYSNTTQDTYQLRTNDPVNPQVYYFDKDGNLTTKPNNNH